MVRWTYFKDIGGDECCEAWIGPAHITVWTDGSPVDRRWHYAIVDRAGDDMLRSADFHERGFTSMDGAKESAKNKVKGLMAMKGVVKS